MFQGVNFGFHETLSRNPHRAIVPTPAVKSIDEAIYSSDEFRMYFYKIKRCARTRSHDWTECPFAHRGEKARRRDPRKCNYAAISCPDYRNGECLTADSCEFAHGVFEYWLHPARYRTRMCNLGTLCERKVCFFAHTPEQLRSETIYQHQFSSREHMEGPSRIGDDGLERRDINGGRRSSQSMNKRNLNFEFLESLRRLRIGGEHKQGHIGLQPNVPDPESPHLGWVSDIIE